MAMVLALDASVSSTGYAIYDTEKACFVVADKIRTSYKKATPTLGKRVSYITTELSHIIFWNAIDIILIEDIYVQKVSSAIPLAMLRGSIQETVYGLDYDELLVAESSKIKKTVAMKGNASKENVYDAVKEKYRHDPVVVKALGEELISLDNKDKNEDIADAIALIDAYLVDPSIAHPA